MRVGILGGGVQNHRHRLTVRVRQTIQRRDLRCAGGDGIMRRQKVRLARHPTRLPLDFAGIERAQTGFEALFVQELPRRFLARLHAAEIVQRFLRAD